MLEQIIKFNTST